MELKYYMPTRIVAGPDCVKKGGALLRGLGERALVMCGPNSARRNGALADVEEALSSHDIGFEVFDSVESNPRVAGCRRAAEEARRSGAAFIVAIGGGSPMDAAKVAALLARNELADSEVFGGEYPGGAMPVVAIPTTAGTGSEVTQYAILTNDAAESKTSVSCDGIFPALAFLDAKYTATLSPRTAASTAMDALSHAVEGYLSRRSDPWSRAVAREALRLFGSALPRLASGSRSGKELDEALRWDLLLASNMAGVVIAQSGTTVVHAMGYCLTYFKDIEHGRANGLLLGPYLEFIAESEPEAVGEVLSALGWKDVAAFGAVLDSLVGEREELGADELDKFSAKAAKAKHLVHTARIPVEADIRRMFREGLRVAGGKGK